MAIDPQLAAGLSMAGAWAWDALGKDIVEGAKDALAQQWRTYPTRTRPDLRGAHLQSDCGALCRRSAIWATNGS